MTRLLGIEFAPLFIPLERRLQTLAVFKVFLFTIILPFITSFYLLYVILFSSYYYLGLFYIAFVYFYDWKSPKRGGYRIQWIRNWTLWKYLRDYFPIKLKKTADFDPTKNYLVGCHPHGILPFSCFCNFNTEATDFSKLYPGITPYLLTLESNFYYPFLRHYSLATGLCDVSKESITYLLTKNKPGTAAMIIVGGAEEALYAHPNTYNTVIKNRKGFVKMAITTGAQLVPCYSFGENNLYQQVTNPPGSIIRSFQTKVKSALGFSPPIFFGRGIFNYTMGFIPYRTPLESVVGKPIEVVRNENPSQEEIDKLHEKYMEELYNLFEEHKFRHNIPEDTHLNFV